jgi:hypothetical protein
LLRKLKSEVGNGFQESCLGYSDRIKSQVPIFYNPWLSLKLQPMKTLISLMALALCTECAFAQSQNTKTVIRTLEQAEVKAVLAKDSVTLLKLWDKDYVVNSPDNVVVFPARPPLTDRFSKGPGFLLPARSNRLSSRVTSPSRWVMKQLSLPVKL